MIRDVSRKTERVDEFKNQIKWTFLRASFCETSFFFSQIGVYQHTNQRNTRNTCRVGKLFIWIKHFRNNPLIGESFTAENNFLVFCIQRIILLSRIVYVDHDWNVSVGMLWLDRLICLSVQAYGKVDIYLSMNYIPYS